MGFTDWKRERFIRQVLQRLARQRVALVLQPGNVWVIEKALPEGEKTAEALRTCHMRGWVEPISKAVPHGRLTPEGELPEGGPFTGTKPIYRLTNSGWQVINQTHTWVVMTFAIALATLIAAITGIFIGLAVSP